MGKIFNNTNLKKTYYYLKRNGPVQTLGAAMERLQSPCFADYQYISPLPEELEAQKQEKWEDPVLFSVVVPAYETKEKFLEQLIDSLTAQSYPYWELILADAGSSDRVKKVWKRYEDSRIRYFSLKENAGISENTNRGIEMAKGEYIGLLDHDDFLTPDALYEMAAAIKAGKENNREYGLLYSDEDKCDAWGHKFFEPHFKMDFNLDLFLTNNYICHFCVVKKELMESLKLRKEYDGAQDYDLCLRVVDSLWKGKERVEENICHIPKVLYHWRCHNDSTAANPESKRYAYEAGKKALEDFIRRRGWQAAVEEMPHVGFYRIRYKDGVFAQRKDIAALGKKRIRAGKVVSGCYDKEGKPLYQGLPFCYSGYLHRAVLAQDAAMLDVDTWQIRPEVLRILDAFLEEHPSLQQADRDKRRKAICEYLTDLGYRLYWDPS